MPAPEEFTVGWICALSTEYVAARAFLDETYDDQEDRAPGDNNDYTLGRIKGHDVVVAVMPAGEYGTASAAGVARDMCRTFVNLKIHLMVGTGGGAPSKRHDVRLGDVVVSTPRDGKGGVFQYDFGKTIQGRAFQPTGFLNQPPRIMRAAVNGLKAEYESDGHQLEEAVESVLEKKRRLRKNYQRPGASSDRLYRSDFRHQDDEASCSEVCGEDPSSLVQRSARDPDDNVVIHYGLIASANQLMKDAVIRDELAGSMGVMCFEMEAAGLMNNFPCLVVRGICNYADTHKNKAWQGYAAMVAAAYAKDLLCRIKPVKVEVNSKFLDAVTETGAQLKDIQPQLVDDEDHRILEWFTTVDYSLQQSESLRKRQEGTCMSQLASSQYRDWLGRPGQKLFCHGMPGAGKTVFASTVVEDLLERFQSDPGMGVAYLYCSYRRDGDQTVEGLVANLLKQLVQHHRPLPPLIKDLYAKHKYGKVKLVPKKGSETLEAVVGSFNRVFIVVDALDECRVTKSLLNELFKLDTKENLSLLATSRSVPEISLRFEGSPRLEISATDEDVRLYLEGHMDELQNSVYRNLELREEIKDSIAKSINGMFLLAELHLKALAWKKSVKAIRTTIEKLSKGTDSYDLAYQDAMERIRSQGRDQAELAMQALSWLVCTRRTLSPAELQHALAVEVDKKTLDFTNISEVEDILSVCAGLIVSDSESDVISLVHYTALEYFERARSRWFPRAETDITTRCLTYLLLDTFGSGSFNTSFELDPVALKTLFKRLARYPLYNHAATYWKDYFDVGDQTTRDLVLTFLQSTPHVQAAIEARGTPKFISDFEATKFPLRMTPWNSELAADITGVHLAAYFGMNELLVALHDLGNSVKTIDRHGRAPISYAALMGNEETVCLLAGLPGVDVNVVDNQERTPLLIALANGHLTTVNALMSLESVALDRSKLLVWLAARDRLSGFNMLTCDGKMDSELSTGLGHKVLSVAAQCGSINVLNALINRGDIDLDARDKEGRSPITLAAMNGNVTAVEALLFTGRVHPNQDVGDGKTPLCFLAENDKRSHIMLATEPKTSYIKKMRAYCRLGSVITRRGNLADFEYLLGLFEVVDVDEKNPLTGRSFVSLAAECGRAEILEMLVLSRGANFRSRDSTGQTPLGLAILEGHSEVFEFLFGQLHPGKRCHKMSPENAARKRLCRTEQDSV